MDNQIINDMPDSAYHARTELSSTGARQLLDSPARFRYQQDHPQTHKAAFDLGSSVHSKVLGVGSQVVSLEFDSFRTKAAQEARDDAYAAGLIPMLARELLVVGRMAEAVLEHPTARTLFEQEGVAEASVFATDPDSGIPMRARFDYLAPTCLDLKTTAKAASPAEFVRTVNAFSYDVQQAWYLDALEIVTGERRPFAFVVVETSAPHLVAVHELDADWQQMGGAKARRARELYAECTTTGVWPGYPTETQTIYPPVWAVYEFEDTYAPLHPEIAI